MRVPYNDKTKHIYETIAKVAKEIAAREEAQKRENGKKNDAA